MRVTATEAKNRFGAVCAHAKTEPVFVEKDGRIDSVILSAHQFESLQSKKQAISETERKKQFELTYAAWLEEQNLRFEKNGLWCDELRVW